MRHDKKGFTLIELIVVIVILGLLSAVAVPKYQDLRLDAQKGVAKGVLGAANGAAAIVFASYLMSPTRTTPLKITSAANLVAAMNNGTAPDGWSQSGMVLTYDDAAPTVMTITITSQTATAAATFATAGF